MKVHAVVEWADGWFPVARGDDPTMEVTSAKFRGVPDEVGRDPETVRLAVNDAPAERGILEALRDQGAERVSFSLTPCAPDPALRELDELATVAADFAK